MSDEFNKSYSDTLNHYARMDAEVLASLHSQKDEWHKWMAEIPFIDFPAGWKVKIVPPFAGAVVRFHIRLPDMNDVVSVYLDCYQRLGFYSGFPYWEVYPYKSDIGRCGINEVEELVKMIADRSKE